MRKKLLIGQIFTLLFGIVIYLLFRSQSLKVFSWLKTVGLDFLNTDLRKETIQDAKYFPDWFLFSLPDGLWIFSYVCFMLYIWKNEVSRQNLFWITVIPLIAILSEIGQKFHLIKGTFDGNDLLFYILGFLLPFIIFNKKSNYKLIKS